MNCDEARGLLDEFHDRELAPNTTEAVRAHLAACASCAGEVRDLENFDRVLHAAPAGPDTVAWDRYAERVRGRIAPVRRLSWSAVIPFAAAALLVVGFARWFETEDRRSLLDRYATAGAGERARLEREVEALGLDGLAGLAAAMIGDPDPQRRLLAARLLAPRLQDEAVRKLLVDRSNELAREDERETVLVDLGFEPGDEDLVAPALEMARSEAHFADATRILRRLDRGTLNRTAHGEIVRRLRELLASDLPKDRDLAIRIAGELEILAEDLVEFLDVPGLDDRVLEFLKRRTGQDFGKDKSAWRGWFGRQSSRM